jgi:hypothetical protein
MKASKYSADSSLLNSWYIGFGWGHNREKYIYMCLYYKKIVFRTRWREFKIVQKKGQYILFTGKIMGSYYKNAKVGWVFLEYSSQEPLSQNRSDLHESFLTLCRFKFVQIRAHWGKINSLAIHSSSTGTCVYMGNISQYDLGERCGPWAPCKELCLEYLRNLTMRSKSCSDMFYLKWVLFISDCRVKCRRVWHRRVIYGSECSSGKHGRENEPTRNGTTDLCVHLGSTGRRKWSPELSHTIVLLVCSGGDNTMEKNQTHTQGGGDNTREKNQTHTEWYHGCVPWDNTGENRTHTDHWSTCSSG